MMGLFDSSKDKKDLYEEGYRAGLDGEDFDDEKMKDSNYEDGYFDAVDDDK
jgi:hypothetical protein